MNIEECKGRYIPVLDHGFVALVDSMGGDETIENAARLSYLSEPRGEEVRRKLIRYLYAHQHMSPFEMVELVFDIGLPIFVMRQLVRHRTASLNEVSARYTQLSDLFYVPESSRIQAQSKTNKQGSGETLEEYKVEHILKAMQGSNNIAYATYDTLLELGLSREVARVCLPVSVYTRVIWKMDLRNLLHMLGLRCEEHAQWEVRQYADVMAGFAKIVAPMAFEAWKNFTYMGIRLGEEELEMLHKCMTLGGYEDEATKVIDRLDKALSLGKKSFDIDFSKARSKCFYDEKYISEK
jgi:thymidylate synthase (FAD)